MAQIKRIPERAEIAPEDRWAVEDLFASDEAWLEELEQIKGQIASIGDCAGKLGQDAATLLAYLTRMEELVARLHKLYDYANFRNDEDTRVAKYQELRSMAMNVYVSYTSAAAFDTPELMAIPEETLNRFYAQEPALEYYRRKLTSVRRLAAHVLSAPEERLLAMSGELASAPEDVYARFANADLRFPDAVDKDGKAHPLSQGTFISCLESEDRILRASAYRNCYGAWAAHEHSVSAMLTAQIKALQFQADARRYAGPLEAALDVTNVPVAVYHNLIEAVHRNLDKLHRYVRLRKRMLGVEELRFYDLYTSLVPGVDVEIPFDRAKELVYDALAPMGETYRSILREGFEHRWIDPYQNVGKRSGAYASGPRVHPFVLLNYDGTLDNVFTLAHEMGHAIHSYFSNHTQRPVDANYEIFVAEVASTCNEALLMRHLLSNTEDRKRRAYLINHFLEQFRGTLYRQTMFAEFELILGRLNQEGAALSADRMCQEYRRLNRLYFGEDIVIDDEICHEWERIPHFYYNYYVFQYATGYSAAIALSRRILREGEPAVRDYIGFLSGGCSKSPIELLKGAGVDMSGPEPVEQALALFGELLDEMETLTESFQ